MNEEENQFTSEDQCANEDQRTGEDQFATEDQRTGENEFASEDPLTDDDYADDEDLFQLDDDFDPLEDADVVEEDNKEEPPNDYQMPIPDADKSVIPEPVELPASERIENLLKGIAGQKYRILAVVQACQSGEKTASEIEASVDAEYPQGGSVYETSRLIELLEKAGAIECTNPEVRDVEVDENEMPEEQEEVEADIEGEEQIDVEDLSIDSSVFEEQAEVIEQAPKERFIATAAGIEAVDKNIGTDPIVQVITEEEQYLPIYERIYNLMNVDGGCAVADLNKAVDSDPLLKEPRRFCTYFLGRLERCNAARWQGTWQLTDDGAKAFKQVFA